MDIFYPPSKAWAKWGTSMVANSKLVMAADYTPIAVCFRYCWLVCTRVEIWAQSLWDNLYPAPRSEQSSMLDAVITWSMNSFQRILFCLQVTSLITFSRVNHLWCCFYFQFTVTSSHPICSCVGSQPSSSQFPLSALLNSRKYKLGRNCRMLSLQAMEKQAQEIDSEVWYLMASIVSNHTWKAPAIL